MPNLLRIANAVPQLVDLGLKLKAARDGDLSALLAVPDTAYATADAVQPGLGQAARGIVDSVGKAAAVLRGEDPNVVDGQFTELAPWTDFVRHYRARKWGIVVVFGKKGEGKTQLALKSAKVWHDRLGWPVDCVGLWPDDKPPWARKIGMARLIARMRKVAAYLDQEETVDDDGLTVDDLARKRKDPVAKETITDGDIEKMKRRIVIVDEAALFFSSMSAAGQTASRDSSRNLNNQARHLETIFVFICQKISEMPTYLQDSAIQFYKWADDEIVRQDYKEGMKRETRERWTEVLAALNGVAGTPYYRPPYDARAAWCYIVAGDIGGHTYRGLMPFTPWDADFDAGRGSGFYRAVADPEEQIS